jgi:hypothetical protein
MDPETNGNLYAIDLAGNEGSEMAIPPSARPRRRLKQEADSPG